MKKDIRKYLFIAAIIVTLIIVCSIFRTLAGVITALLVIAFAILFYMIGNKRTGSKTFFYILAFGILIGTSLFCILLANSNM